MKNVVERAARKLGYATVKPPAFGARSWSNKFIGEIAPVVTGRVVNVSAWMDEDKEGRHYRDYFTAATSYETTNFGGWRGADAPSDHDLDLQAAMPEALRGAFDLVFNHTTLEHVFDIHRAFEIMAGMSRDAMLIIVPFIQHLHGPEDGDFWRPSPYAMRRLFRANGMEPILEQAGPEGGKTRYLGYFAARNPDSWKSKLPQMEQNAEAVLRTAS